MKKARRFLQGAVIVAAATSAAGAGGPEFRVPLMERPPVIDGRIDPDEWAVSAGFEGLEYNGKLQQRRAQGYVGATEDAIFVAIRSRLPDEGTLRASVTRDTLKAVFDDSVEAYIDPTPDADARVIYQFLVNSLGKGGYKVHLFGGAKEEVAWEGKWEQRSGFHDGHWHFECRIPVASMSAATDRKTTEGVWGVNLTRNWKAPWEWSSLTGGYTDPLCRFSFVEKGAPGVTYTCRSDPFLADFEGLMRLYNPSGRPLPLSVSLVLDRNRMPTVRQDRTLTIRPRTGARVTLKVPEDDATTRFELHASVKSADGRVTYYDRKTAWPRGKPYRWVAGEKKKVLPVDFRFAYYPYRNRMRIVADITGLPREAKAERVVATIRREDGKTAVETVTFPAGEFRDGKLERAFGLPPLEGAYEIALKAEGEKVPEGEIVKEFERKVFPWEHTKLGTSTRVYPPFTPIEVAAPRTSGAKLRTVLREHALNGAGLWDQVEAKSAHTGITKRVLASPMRYVAKVDGQAKQVRAGRLKFTSRGPHEVTAEGGFTAGALRASAGMTWDYDGTMKVELTLQPTGGARVDELTLEIPLRKEAATHIHANADRIRAPVAMRIPEGDGVVWDGSKVACDEFVKNFCPYVYVGSPVRGISWFAENDLNWSWDPKTPNLDLYRAGEAVSLRVHLVSEPVVIDKPRTITFGLLAAPVKPRLSPGGPNWWRYRYYRGKYTLLGTDINWLSQGTCGSVYPVGGEMYFWEMIARGNREKLPGDVVEEVVKRGLKYFEPYGEGRVESWRRHVHHNLRSRYGKKMVFYYNRASHQAAEEFQTFEDEWCLNDLRSYGKGNGIGEIKIVPPESYVDHALYWYSKSFEIGGNQGVYWDNWFIAPSFNTEMTDAYRRDDGSIVPAVGIWQQRELSRRTFVMMNEKGMLPVTFPHMTSFNPLPMMAFSTVQYDWEWKYSMGDVQDRHSRELILLMGTGDLAGVWPVPLGDHGKLGDDLWTQRTFTAVRLLHELDGYGGFGNAWQKSHKENAKLAGPVLKMLDEPGLKVYRYWDERPQPAKANSPDVPTIVYSVPGKEAVVVAVGYAKADVDVKLGVDLRALGFGRGCRIVDAETGERVALRRGGVAFRLKKHDCRVLRLTPGE